MSNPLLVAGNGLEALELLRNGTVPRERRLILLDAYNLNVAGYLLKPVTFSNFCERMAALNKYWSLVEMP